MKLVPAPKSLKLAEGMSTVDAAAIRVLDDPILGEEAYVLEIKKGGIEIRCSAPSGEFYARETLRQIASQNDGRYPCLKIEDSPTLSQRGYMLDVSRCRVPTLETLKEFIDLLARLKYNQLQLYTEHTFAYRGHETVWHIASPYTAEDIKEIDTYCAERFIELVPNQNSLGHFERWLKHPEYSKYAECPDGFTHPISGQQKPCGSTLVPDEQSFELMTDLYEQLLPHFRSNKFNIGCDEPWELGQGKSAGENSKGKLFCDWVKRLSFWLEARGVTPYMWADVALQYPEFLKELPDGLHALLWGYEVDHPFDEQCRQLKDAGVEFLVCPGDSSWNSIGGRWGIASENLKKAATAAEKWGAQGLLVTHWGDNGHAQSWPTFYPGVLLGGECAWNGAAGDDSGLEHGIDCLVAGMSDAGLGRWLVCAGMLDERLGSARFNRSLLYALVRESPFAEDFEEAINVIDPVALEGEIEALRNCLDDFLVRGKNFEECQFIVDTLECCLSMLKEPGDISLGSLKEKAQAIWLTRFRSGGLEESVNGYLKGRG